MAVILGIDTSNYTTSLSVVDNDKLISDRRTVLTVKTSEVGLRQSEALFQHINNLPVLMDMVRKDIEQVEIDAIGVSTKPRDAADSYMPVFKAGERFAEFLGYYLNKPVIKTNHQAGHIEAGVYSSGMETANSFIAIHFSGGTSEILKVVPNASGYDIDIIGGSDDLSAGQFIDRTGVSLGFPFPSGRDLDKCALEGDFKNCPIPSSCREGYMSFSGPETAASRLINQKKNSNDICASVMECISKSIIKSLMWCTEKYSIHNILFVGGVSSSVYIRKRVNSEFKSPKYGVFFCSPQYCTDNSVGTAFLCGRIFKSKKINMEGIR